MYSELWVPIPEKANLVTETAAETKNFYSILYINQGTYHPVQGLVNYEQKCPQFDSSVNI